MNIITTEWMLGRVPLINGVIEASGHVHLVRPVDPPRTLPFALQVEQETEFVHLLPVTWTTAIPFEVVRDSDSELIAVFGECGMGADGFVALQASEGADSLLWLAFFDFSNPFESARFDRGVLKVRNNMNEEWSFPLLDPWSVEIQPYS